MSRNENPRRGAKGMTGAVLAGVLMVPATAIVAVALAHAVSAPTAAAGAEFVSSTTTSIAIPDTSVSTTTMAGTDATTGSIDDACGPGADGLIRKEADHALTAVEAAALAALREICADHGVALPGPPVEEIVRVVDVPAIPSTTMTATTMPSDEYDDDHEDHDHDRDDDHDDDHDDDQDDDHGGEDDD